MNRLVSVGLSVMALVFCMPSFVGLAPKGKTAGDNPPRSMPVVGPEKWTAHLRAPADDSVIRDLMIRSGYIRRDAPIEDLQAALKEFKELWVKRQPATPNPNRFRELLRIEREASRSGRSPKELTITPPPAFRTLVVPVEFAGSDTFTANVPDGSGGCMDVTVETSGPLHNQILPPGPRDNFTLWYENATPALYDELYFGLGPDAGIVVDHPNLGPVDCTGWTVANYYHEQSNGAFVPEGYVYPWWLQSPHSEAWYGVSHCMFGWQDRRIPALVRDVVGLVNADDPAFPWQEFDANADGRVDNFTIIHAGMGEEAGGGAQADFALWSQAGAIDWPDGHLACSAGSPGCPDRDIYVREFSLDPENFDVGVGAEEFGHAALGLPDLYTLDSGNSVAHWALMSAGSWNGPLAGMQPAPFPGWFRYILGWWNPQEIPYDTDPVEFTVGQLSLPPAGTVSGVKIDLPDRVVATGSRLGSGRSWWSGAGAFLNVPLTRSLDLEGAQGSAVLSFQSQWDMEEDCDFGLVEISVDGGGTWIAIRDLDGILGLPVAIGNSRGWALSGSGEGTLRFDLSGLSGSRVFFRLRYVTDISVNGKGWWADDFRVVAGGRTLLADDLEGDTGPWETDGWSIVPRTDTYSRYYLVEWRNHSGYDQGLQYAYETVWYDTDEWEVDRVPYTLPGAIVWLRDSSYDFDSYLLDADFEDGPSAGPKYPLLVVDSHPFPYSWDGIQYSSGQDVILGSAAQAADAAFTLEYTEPFTLRRGFDDTWGWAETPPETKTFGPREAAPRFDDGTGYYPGFWWDEAAGTIRYWDRDASAVIPAAAAYTTRITRLDGAPCYDRYGTDLGYTVLGSGNPGIDGAGYGVHMEVLEQGPTGQWGRLRFWNDAGAPSEGLLAADFGTRGLWLHDRTDWSVFLEISPDIMLPWENLLLLGFEGYGLYVTDRRNWLHLVPVNPDAMLFWGARLVLGFESYGLYTLDADGWKYLSPVCPDTMAAWGDLLVLGFESYGMYAYSGKKWSYLAPVCPVSMAAWDDLLMLGFKFYGLYSYDGEDWKSMHAGTPNRMIVWRDRLVLNFPGYGVYAYDGRSWKRILDTEAQALASWGDDLVVDTGLGILAHDGTAWRELIPFDPEDMAAVYFD